MTNAEDNVPSDQEVLESGVPNRELRERCLRPGNSRTAALSAISDAEAALDTLSVNFAAWMAEEVQNLALARDALRKSEPAAGELERLFAAAHDLKGQASTLGYPFVGQICASLCKLLEDCPKTVRVPPVLIDQHVDSVRAIVREEALGDDNPTAAALSDKLHDVVGHFIDSHLKASKQA